MTGFKKFLYGVAGFITLTLLLQLPFAFAVSSVIGDRTTIDSALQESGAYEKAVPLIIDDIVQNSSTTQNQDVLKDPKAREAISSAIKPESVRSTTQSVIDPLYAWLEGKTPTFDFTLDLTTYRDNILANLGTYVEQRAQTLPACTLTQLQTVDFTQNVLDIPCVPPGVTSAQIKDRFTSQVTAQSDFLRDPVITRDELVSQNAAPQTVNPDIPKVYQNFKNGKWTTLALTIIAVALLIFARHDRRAGARFVGKTLLTAGITLGLSVVGYYVLFSNLTTSNHAADLVLAVIREITDDIISYAQWFVVAYLLVGAGLIFRFKNHKNQISGTEPDQGPILS